MVSTKVKAQKAICVSASNIVKKQAKSTSYYISEIIRKILSEKNVSCEILDLRQFDLSSCTGCDQCAQNIRCSLDADFNRIYEKAAKADYIFFVSPRCAPIPAKLSMLLEKMEKLASWHLKKGHSCQWELHGMLAGIISYGNVSYGNFSYGNLPYGNVPYGKGEGSASSQISAAWQEEMLSYKTMVNDIIANVLHTVQLRTIPYNSTWDTGIALPVGDDFQVKEQKGEEGLLEADIRKYVEVIVQTSKSLHALY